MRLQRSEREKILALENVVAISNKQTENHVRIDESNSILLNQLVTFNIADPARQPPPLIIAKLQTMEAEYRIGSKLSGCRSPGMSLS